MNFCNLNDYSKQKSSQCSYIFYKPILIKNLCGRLIITSSRREKLNGCNFIYFIFNIRFNSSCESPYHPNGKKNV